MEQIGGARLLPASAVEGFQQISFFQVVKVRGQIDAIFGQIEQRGGLQRVIAENLFRQPFGLDGLGAFQRDPVTTMTVPKTGLTDQQIADIVAYMQALK